MKLHTMNDWQPENGFQKITTIDCHTAGEPFRVIVDGLPDIPGSTILEKRRYVKENLDGLRTALMWEPRGHADMYGCIITPSVSSEADFGVLFMHNDGFSTMCGHGIIGVVTVVLETGLFPKTAPITTLRIDSPAGLITAHAHIVKNRVQQVSFQNVPSFVLALDQTVDVPDLGPVTYDLAFGGAFYAYTSAPAVGLSGVDAEFQNLIKTGMAIKQAVMTSRAIVHPFEPDLGFLYGAILIAPAIQTGSHSRNVCIFAEGEVDRSPTGTGVSGRLAIHFARGEIGIDESIVIESIIGTRFSGRVLQETRFGSYPAIIPEVTGSAYITGKHQFLIDPNDPLKQGFILR